MNFNQSEKLISDLRYWYHNEIHAAAARSGGIEELSESLGYNRLYLYKLIKRDSFSALRRIVKQIYKNPS